MAKLLCPGDLPLGIFFSAVIKHFSVISASHYSKLLDLRIGKAILFKNDSLSESSLEKGKFFLKNLHMQKLISLRSVMPLVSSIKCFTVVFIAFCFSRLNKNVACFSPC